MSWDSKLIDRANQIIELYPQKRSALGPLLYLAQEKEGYIDDDSVVEISKLIGITEVQVRSVASFYTMYKQEPSGKYLLSVCKSISCEINNSKEVIDNIKEFTGLANNETDLESTFTFEEVECIGACGGAPAVQVNYETVEGVTPTKALELCKYLKEEVPQVIVADDLQDKFGGTKSFDWAIEDNSGTSSTAPGFQIIGTSEEK
ncbi:MAG: NAD(P)H-dependent oxidoreductase subunit E [Actinomycetota bacterium]|jgi:NADH-quinone oxidoreductase subunit E|nr:NAD(P)H-dependent oxidoreductase subunit E [Actinomycetota bacterium]|tara:strand:+ start:58 stop:669 length:612 start_codon:yes stop_codon:yes gene_type:complete